MSGSDIALVVAVGGLLYSVFKDAFKATKDSGALSGEDKVKLEGACNAVRDLQAALSITQSTQAKQDAINQAQGTFNARVELHMTSMNILKGEHDGDRGRRN